MNTIWFNDIKKDDIDLVGNKSIEISDLYIKELPIPPGFVITTEAFKEFLDYSGIRTTIIELISNLDVDNHERLNEISERIQDLIIRAPFPEHLIRELNEEYSNLNINPETFNYASKALDMIKAGRELPYIALRPSTRIGEPDSETFLDVRGNVPLHDSLKRCWASSYNKDIIYYRIKNNLPHDSVIAIIVQKQVKPDKSGLIDINKNSIIIKSSFGLPETVIGNLIVPDTFVIDKSNFLVKDKKIGSKEFMSYFDENIKRNSRRSLGAKSGEMTLSDSEINRLVDICIKIEDDYGPKQVEFAIRSGSILIINTKPMEQLESFEDIKIDSVNPETITKIGIDLENTNDSYESSNLDVDNILIKIESILKKRDVNPMSLVQDNEFTYISFLIDELEKVAKAFGDKNILIKTSDLINENEKNPMIGWRGIRRALDENVILRAEFNTIKRLNEKGYNNIKVVLPFVSNLSELRQARELAKEIGMNNEIGIMIETPSSCEIIDNFCKEGLKFVVFGADNLTQLILGVDRFNDRTAKLFNEKHPALLRNIQKVVGVCRQFNVETNFIGRISSDPEMVDFLVSVGLNSIITNINDIDRVKGMIIRTENRLVVK